MADGERVSDIRPLQVWQDRPLSKEDAERIKAAKRELNLPYMVQLAKAASEGESRVIALGSPPPFVCDYFLLESTLDPNLRDAVEWVLGERGDDFRIVTMAEWLSELLDCDVVEVVEDAVGPVDSSARSDYVVGSARQGYFGGRGPVDPGLSDEREYRRAIRETYKTAA